MTATTYCGEPRKHAWTRRTSGACLAGALLLAALCAGSPSRAAAVQADVAPECLARPGLGESINYSCVLTVARPGQHFVFQATFDGGHDDTQASLVAQLDGAAIECDAGSKTSLMGEYGTVSLTCRVSPVGAVGSLHRLDLALVWSHAQYARFDIRGD
jgi:hypothetical protein